MASPGGVAAGAGPVSGAGLAGGAATTPGRSRRSADGLGVPGAVPGAGTFAPAFTRGDADGGATSGGGRFDVSLVPGLGASASSLLGADAAAAGTSGGVSGRGLGDAIATGAVSAGAVTGG
ncbi:MAG: hypothetical protein L0027_05380, partial [Candidatus Rokubacteria bacterium]|nr:hypothetical protein [Candidatus Rokubacteria bacterium]